MNNRVGSSPTNRTTSFMKVLMDTELLEQIKQWNIEEQLPPFIGGFQFIRKFSEEADGFYIASYEWKEKGWQIHVLYDTVNSEFSLKIDMRFMEMTWINFISEEFSLYKREVEMKLANAIDAAFVHPERNFNALFRAKELAEWDYASVLPQQWNDFVRVVEPRHAIRVLNGSYIIGAYCHEGWNSALLLFYNVLRDDLFAELRIHHVPKLVHDFDSAEVKEFEKKLRLHFDEVMTELQREAEQGVPVVS